MSGACGSAGCPSPAGGHACMRHACSPPPDLNLNARGAHVACLPHPCKCSSLVATKLEMYPASPKTRHRLWRIRPVPSRRTCRIPVPYFILFCRIPGAHPVRYVSLHRFKVHVGIWICNMDMYIWEVHSYM